MGKVWRNLHKSLLIVNILDSQIFNSTRCQKNISNQEEMEIMFWQEKVNIGAHYKPVIRGPVIDDVETKKP